MVSCIIFKIIKGNYLSFLRKKCCMYIYNLLHRLLEFIVTFKWLMIYIHLCWNIFSFPLIVCFSKEKKKKKKIKIIHNFAIPSYSGQVAASAYTNHFRHCKRAMWWLMELILGAFMFRVLLSGLIR